MWTSYTYHSTLIFTFLYLPSWLLILHLCSLWFLHIFNLPPPNSSYLNSPVTFSLLFLSPLSPDHFTSLSRSSSSFSLFLEVIVRAPAGHPAVVKAAQTVTWSAWSHGLGAALTQTAPTAPSGHPSLKPAASLASPSLPGGIALVVTKAHREAAKALAQVRTKQKIWGGGERSTVGLSSDYH